MFVLFLCCIAANTVEAFSSTATSPCLLSKFQSRLLPSVSTQARIGAHPGPKAMPSTYQNIKPPSTSIEASSGKDTSDISVTPKSNSPGKNATAVYALMLCNLVVFLLDKVFRYRLVARNLYLNHYRWKWWQPLTSCFCHADRQHLSNNLFLLLLFGRSVEDDQGWGGLLLSYIFCGVFSSLTSIFLLPRNTVSIGASGAVFGLFAVSTLAKLSWSDLDWRKVVEVTVLGEFVFRQITSEISTAAGGGMAGINHVAHLSGAAAGAILVFGMRAAVANFDKTEEAKNNAKS